MSTKTGKKRPKVVISGYYGFDNCGDEAVLLSIVHCLKKLKPDIRITILSGNAKKTRELYDVNAVNRWNPFMIARELLSCGLLISGGGSLLQDVTSSKSVFYYLSVIRLAAAFKKKIMIYSQGIGPLNNGKNRIKVSKTLNRCDLITVRDEHSVKLLKEIGIKSEIQVTCDPVLALDRETFDDLAVNCELGDCYNRVGNESDRKPLLMAVVRNWSDDRHLLPVAEFLNMQVRQGWDVLLVPAHFPADTEAQNKISALITESVSCINKCLTARQFLALTAHADMVFSMRLHGLICAFAFGTPMLGLSYDPKVNAFMDQAGLGKYCFPFDRFDPAAAALLAAGFGAAASGTLQEKETLRQQLHDMAWETAKKAIALLDM